MSLRPLPSLRVLLPAAWLAVSACATAPPQAEIAELPEAEVLFQQRVERLEEPLL